MNTVRLNITIPQEIARRLEGIKSKSAFIAKAITEYTKGLEKERLVAEMREGYRVSRKEDFELTCDWESTIGDGID